MTKMTDIIAASISVFTGVYFHSPICFGSTYGYFYRKPLKTLHLKLFSKAEQLANLGRLS
jgi:hypothetical protein